MDQPLPVLYSFRRCPYAIRARLAINYSGVKVEQRDIELKNKPAAMLVASPKGTVPVLVLNGGQVIDESRDIIHWALGQNDPEAWFETLNEPAQEQVTGLLNQCDEQFKPCLDRYKYWVGYPEQSQLEYRQQCEQFLQQWEQQLSTQRFLLGRSPSLADNGIFPFVRQFAYVDIGWFEQSPYPHLKAWLQHFIESDSFQEIMRKRPLWQPLPAA